MILVVNLNASVDKRYQLSQLALGTVQRADSVENTAGGKGMHVANVAVALGAEVLVTGFLGGMAEPFFVEQLKRRKIREDFVRIVGETRSCLALLTADGMQTEVLEPGPEISSAECTAFQLKFAQLLPKADVVVLSGSLPRGISADFYAKLMRDAENQGHRQKFLLDTSGEALAEGIRARPYFVKPNQDELRALRGQEILTDENAAHEVRHFLQEGITLPVLSLGACGSLAGYGKKIFRITVPKITCKNPVGSGDAYVAGVAVGLSRNLPIKEVLRLGAACGTANAIEEESGFVRQVEVEKLLPQVQVEIIN